MAKMKELYKIYKLHQIIDKSLMSTIGLDQTENLHDLK